MASRKRAHSFSFRTYAFDLSQEVQQARREGYVDPGQTYCESSQTAAPEAYSPQPPSAPCTPQPASVLRAPPQPGPNPQQLLGKQMEILQRPRGGDGGSLEASMDNGISSLLNRKQRTHSYAQRRKVGCCKKLEARSPFIDSAGSCSISQTRASFSCEICLEELSHQFTGLTRSNRSKKRWTKTRDRRLGHKKQEGQDTGKSAQQAKGEATVQSG